MCRQIYHHGDSEGAGSTCSNRQSLADSFRLDDTILQGAASGDDEQERNTDTEHQQTGGG